MKIVGLLGGMSWESTAEYYRLFNSAVKERLGGLHSAQLLLNSLDFEVVAALQRKSDWNAAANLLAQEAAKLERAGAECVLICTNTMHIVADQVQALLSIPLLHIADAAGERLRSDARSCVGLLGTSFTMEQEFYRKRLADRFGLTVCIPSAEDRKIVHRVIFEELCLGHISAQSKLEYQRIIEALAANGADSVLLACTEIGLLIGPTDVALPVYDSTRIHVEAALSWATQ
jgi:aspartate racemase